MSLDTLLVDLVSYTSMLIDIASKQASAAHLGKPCQDISRYYRAIGICRLLTGADTDDFHYGLIQSGLTRKYYLSRCASEGIADDPALKSSFVDPFFDAWAAGERELASELAVLAVEDHRSSYEYEDDYLYAQILMRLTRGRDAAELAGLLLRFEELCGSATVRLQLCSALLTREQTLFDDAFKVLLQQHEERNDALADPKRDSVLALDYCFEPNRWIFVEGLALLRIAAHLGLDAGGDYKYCPAVARTSPKRAFVPKSFPNLKLTESF